MASQPKIAPSEEGVTHHLFNLLFHDTLVMSQQKEGLRGNGPPCIAFSLSSSQRTRTDNTFATTIDEDDEVAVEMQHLCAAAAEKSNGSAKHGSR